MIGDGHAEIHYTRGGGSAYPAWGDAHGRRVYGLRKRAYACNCACEQRKGEFTLICNDGAVLNGPDGSECYGVAKLIRNRQVKRLIASHVGLNPEVGQQMNEGSLQVDLIPQGSFAEMIRAGGAGLGGVLTPTGVGTPVEDSPLVYSAVELEGKRYLMMRPLRAEFALVSGYYIDRKGNIWYRGTTRNFNHVMALAADTVIAEADYIVECGQIAPENVVTPGILVDYVVQKRRRTL